MGHEYKPGVSRGLHRLQISNAVRANRPWPISRRESTPPDARQTASSRELATSVKSKETGTAKTSGSTSLNGVPAPSDGTPKKASHSPSGLETFSKMKKRMTTLTARPLRKGVTTPSRQPVLINPDLSRPVTLTG